MFQFDYINRNSSKVTYDRVSRGMLHEDRMTFGLLLARIYLKGSLTYIHIFDKKHQLDFRIKNSYFSSESSYDQEFNHLLRGSDVLGSIGSTKSQAASVGGDLASILTSEQADGLRKLISLPAMSDLAAKITKEQMSKFLHDQYPERSVPVVWQTKEPLSELLKFI